MAKGMTQSELATAVGLTRTSITNIEKGRQKLLVHTLLDIALSLDVECARLITFDNVDTSSTALLNIPDNVGEKDRAKIESVILLSKRKGR